MNAPFRVVAIAIVSTLAATAVGVYPASAISIHAGAAPGAAGVTQLEAQAGRTASRKASTGTHKTRIYDRAKSTTYGEVVYTVSVGVRSARNKSHARVLLRHVVDGRVTKSRSVSVTTRRTWRSVKVSLRTGTSPGRVQVWVLSPAGRYKVARARSLRVTSTAATSGVVTPPAPPAVDPTPPTPPTVDPTPPTPPTVDPTPPTPPPVDPTPPTAPAVDPTPPTPAPEPATVTWVPNLVENFDSWSAARWTARDNKASANESSYLLARNVTVDDGVLRIQAKREGAGGRAYTSGRVETTGKYSVPDYFRAEIRAKVPFERGLWSAPLWFRPTDGGAGEIDLAETYGAEQNRPKVHQSIHSAYGATHQVVSLSGLFSLFTSNPSTSWHTYTIEKTRNRIEMWVDGRVSAVFTPSSAPWFNLYYETGRRWSLLTNLQVGGGYGLPDATTSWVPDASAMQVDYIKTWTLG